MIIDKEEKRIKSKIFASLLLLIALCITAYALFGENTVTVEENYFQTGIISIDLNGGLPVIEEDEYIFEPGMTVEKPFYIQSASTCKIYYKIYFDNIEGGLADVLKITVFDGEKVLYEGTANSLSRENSKAADDTLMPGERRDLKIRFHFPEKSGNLTQDLRLKFDMCADAVQEKNNPERKFD